jgi:CHAD domain-containing protein
MLRRSLTKLAHTLEFYGWEEDISRMKKVNEIKRVIYLIDRIREDEYLKDAETELGEIQNKDWLFDDIEDTPEQKEHNRKVFQRSHDIREAEWKELWKILKGNKMDGGMRGWWD